VTGLDGTIRQIDESAWIPDDETPGQVAILTENKGLLAGLWRSGGVRWDPFDVRLGYDETLYVLTGSAQLQVNDEPPMQLSPGAVVTIRAGSVTRWSVEADFVELWICY
jgi:uncharacterized cupin superfamily protein